ncbi:hypothetical protein [Algoriphagus boritolerans]|uniref:hypothetical protein n=1 Tax=Algoriphagus boritolerans TaxID=308111 RepID=UPI000AC7B85F
MIIKGIGEDYKLEFEKLLGQYGINVRHSMLELNWHLPVNNKSAIKLKKYLVSYFDKHDISTYGLTFGITDYTRKAYYFTSIIIEKKRASTRIERLENQEYLQSALCKKTLTPTRRNTWYMYKRSTKLICLYYLLN